MPKISFKNDIDDYEMETTQHGKMRGSGSLGKIPTNIERLMEKNRDKVISNITIFRLPLADELVKVLNVLTDSSVKKFLKKNDIDSLYHLGMFIETTDGKMFIYDKAQNFNFQIAKKSFLKQKDIELSPVSNLPANLTIGELVEAGKKRMGRRFTYYSALKWNCQYFVQQSLEAIDATFNVDFVIQDLSQLVKKIPAFQRRFGVALTTFAREADKVVSHTKDAIKDTAKDVKKITKKAVKKTKRFLGFGYSVAML